MASFLSFSRSRLLVPSLSRSASLLVSLSLSLSLLVSLSLPLSCLRTHLLSCARALYLTRVFSLSLALAMSLTFPPSLCQMRSLLRAHGSEGHTDKGKEHAKSKRSVWMGGRSLTRCGCIYT